MLVYQRVNVFHHGFALFAGTGFGSVSIFVLLHLLGTTEGSTLRSRRQPEVPKSADAL